MLHREAGLKGLSGASGEILPLVERIPPTTTLIAITNHADSPLARAAGHTLLQYAGTETTVATKKPPRFPMSPKSATSSGTAKIEAMIRAGNDWVRLIPNEREASMRELMRSPVRSAASRDTSNPTRSSATPPAASLRDPGG